MLDIPTLVPSEVQLRSHITALVKFDVEVSRVYVRQISISNYFN